MVKALFSNDSAVPVVCELVYVLDKNRPLVLQARTKNQGQIYIIAFAMDGKLGIQAHAERNFCRIDCRTTSDLWSER